MLLGAVAQAQNFAITATTEAAIRKNIVKGNAANYGFGMINDTLKLVGLTTRNVIFTGSTSKTDIGLGNVDNTSDLNKPVSTATQTALNLKANIASPTFTGTVGGITKSMVGLGNVDNTTDAGKPISTATQTALDAKQATLSGTGFVKSTAGTISYDNSTYLSTSTAASTYLPISNPTATGTLTAPTIANTLGANFATSSGNVGIGTTTNQGYKLDVNGTLRTVNDAYFATTSGNVGIGTTSPQNLLHIKGAASVGVGVRNSHLIIESAETAGVGVGAVLKFGGQSGNTVNPYSFGTIEAKKESAVANNYSSYMTFQTIESNGGSTERMRISGNGNIGIGTDAPLASSILDIASTTKGVLLPRMTTEQINAIASPADGLTVYNTTLKVICFYDSSAAGWRKVSHSSM